MSLVGYNPTIITGFKTGTYHHVALSISGTVHTLYLDGSAVAINSNAGDLFSVYKNTIQNLYIGCAGDLSYGYTGIIDDFKIWNRALPDTEVNAIYLADRIPVINSALFYFPLQNENPITNLGNYSDTYTLEYNATYSTISGKIGLDCQTNALQVSGFSITNDYTICLWFNSPFYDSTFPFGTRNSNGANLLYLGNINNPNPSTVQVRYTDYMTVVGYEPNTWAHFVFVVNSVTNILNIYVNNVFAGSININGSYHNITTLEFPHYSDGLTGSYLRHLCVFNSTLTTAQISEIYNTTI